MGVHIFRELWQPFTRFYDSGMLVKFAPRSLHVCDECRDSRQARNLEVQAYANYWRVRCKGGKHPGWS